jgi:hypothetical protein
MTAQALHRVDVCVAFLTIVSWTTLLVMLEKVADRRVRWVRLASFALGPVHQAYDRLPEAWGPLHAVLVGAAVLWLGAAVLPWSKVRTWLFVAAAGCLVFLATAWALTAGHA